MQQPLTARQTSTEQNGVGRCSNACGRYLAEDIVRVSHELISLGNNKRVTVQRLTRFSDNCGGAGKNLKAIESMEVIEMAMSLEVMEQEEEEQ